MYVMSLIDEHITDESLKNKVTKNVIDLMFQYGVDFFESLQTDTPSNQIFRNSLYHWIITTYQIQLSNEWGLSKSTLKTFLKFNKEIFNEINNSVRTSFEEYGSVKIEICGMCERCKELYDRYPK